MRKFLALLAVCCLALSCETEYQNKMADQEKAIDQYVSANYADFRVVRNEGVTRIVIDDGVGEEIGTGDWVNFMYEGYVFENGRPAGTFTNGQYDAVLGKGKIIEGLEMGLVGSKHGEECIIIFTAEHGYGREAVNVVPEASALLFVVEVIDVDKNWKDD